MLDSERRKRVRTCDDPRRGGERGSSPRPTRGGRSRTGLARSRTIRDFHGVPESLLRQTHAPELTPNGGPLCSALWKTTPCRAQQPSLTWTRRSLRSHRRLTFSKSFYQGGLINRRAVLRTAYAQFVFLAGGADHDQMERMREYLSALCKGWNVQQVKEIVAETLHDLIDPIIYDEAASLIEEHHTAGRDVVIVSTSGAEVVEPIGELLGADRVVATRMVVGDDGCFTGEVEYYAYGPTKAEAVQAARRVGGIRPRRAATPTAIPRPMYRCWSPSATRTRSTRTGRCGVKRRSGNGRFSSSTARFGSSSGCPRSRCHPARRSSPPQRWAQQPSPRDSSGTPRAGARPRQPPDTRTCARTPGVLGLAARSPRPGHHPTAVRSLPPDSGPVRVERLRRMPDSGPDQHVRIVHI